MQDQPELLRAQVSRVRSWWEQHPDEAREIYQTRSQEMRDRYRRDPALAQRDSINLYQPAGVQHKSSKEWGLVDPTGNVHRFKNLKAFIQSHRQMFTDYQLGIPEGSANRGRCRAHNGLATLRPGTRSDRPNPRSWYGWTWSLSDRLEPA